ncbi:MAG: signal peptidase I [Ignisphaera sp.]|nr:signal peptidase I [Ignisphaera sp.]MCX8168153.1 signal peptidase I [Ignisphaera sp.]MDW8085207.1 signal peptidase I [Ignisphaera sp.]
MYIIRKYAKILLNVLLALIVAFLLYANIAYYVFGQITLAIVRGGSMYPLLRDGDLVIVVPTHTIDLGDVIVYRNDREEFVIHRVVAKLECNGKTLYVTKGDNNPFIDSLSIVYRKSIECSDARQTTINSTSRKYVEYLLKLLEGVNRGIDNNRIVGKALSINNIVIKVTGLLINS